MKYTILVFCFVICLNSCKGKQVETTTDTDYFELVRPAFSGEQAYKTTAYVEQFWRIAGNTGFNKSIYHIVEGLESAGFKELSKAKAEDRLVYRIEKRPMNRPTWEPVDGSVHIVGQDNALLSFATNRNMIYFNSTSTPPDGITAPVIQIKDVTDLDKQNLKDKIVYTTLSAYRIYKKVFAEKGALGIITYNNPAYLQPKKNATSIQFRGLPASETKAWGIALSYAAKTNLDDALSKGAVQLKVQITTKMYTSEELTVVADVKGTELPDERLVFSAHVQEPGANDNASGVGTQLEMAQLTAKLLQAKKIDLKRTLSYLWGDEIISTRRYIKEDSVRAKGIKWGISLDMVGETTAVTGGSFLIEKMPDPSAIWTRGNDKHSEWGGSPMQLEDMQPHYLNDFIIDQFQKQGTYANWEVNTNPFEGGSDHTPFLKANIPGLLLWHFTDQFYHTDNDRLDKVSQTTMKNVGTAALVSALTLINANETTGKEFIHLLSNAATKRLQAEYELSAKLLANGTTTAEQEIKILSTWEDWYLKSIASIADVENNPSESFLNAISKAKKTVSKGSKAHIEALKK